MLEIANSYIYIEGKIIPSDLTKCFFLFINAWAFLYDEIHYDMWGKKIFIVRKKGIISTVKIMVSYGSSLSNLLLGYGFGLTGEKLNIFLMSLVRFLVENYPSNIRNAHLPNIIRGVFLLQNNNKYLLYPTFT